MKIVLLVLSGNAQHARPWLLEKYPGAVIENLPRELIDQGSWSQRLGVLRSLKPDIFAITTERLIWQRGQNALLLFGALGGATRVLLVDTRGDSREESRPNILARLPARLATEKRFDLRGDRFRHGTGVARRGGLRGSMTRLGSSASAPRRPDRCSGSPLSLEAETP